MRRAARTGELLRVKFFVDLGCPMLEISPPGYTPLHSATLRSDPPAYELVEFLLDSGVDPSARSKYGETALAYTLTVHHFDMARRLLDRGALRGDPSWPSIFPAVLRRDFDAIAAYQNQVSEEYFSFGAWSPVQIAARMGDLELVQYLAKLGANLAFRDRGQYSLLTHAVMGGSVEVLDWCLTQAWGGRLTPDDIQGAHQSAAKCNRLAAAEWLIDHDVPLTEDMFATPLHSCNTPQMADFYLAHGEDIDGISGEGYSVLMSAAEEGNALMAEYWIHRGANLEATSTGATALHYAVKSDNDEVIDLLLRAGSEVDSQDVDGDTPICYARSLEAAQRLIDAGANLDEEHWVYGAVRGYLLEKDPAFRRIL